MASAVSPPSSTFRFSFLFSFSLFAPSTVRRFKVHATPACSPLSFGGGELRIGGVNSGRSDAGLVNESEKGEAGIFVRTGDDALVADSSVPGRRHSIPPLVNALKLSSQEDAASFHFPGHNRGRAAPFSLTDIIGIRPFLHDLPELPELDNLFSPSGPILEAQKEAAELFGASETWFLVGGTTCGVQAAIMSTCSPGDTIVLPRNCHLSAISGMVLSGAIPKYIVPEFNSQWEIAGGISPQQVKKALDELSLEGRKASAVFLTSPTYHGLCSNIAEISDLCHSIGVPLIVDEAHGAHLGLHHQLPPSALAQGADVSVQSTHKVLCSLTQSSMLHVSGNIIDRDRISGSLQTLQSSSPSYLLLASLDAARAQLSENRETLFTRAINLSVNARRQIEEIPGISVINRSSFLNCRATDPLRLTIGFWKLGLSGFQADDALYGDNGVVCELVENQSVTFAMNLGTCEEHVKRLVLGIRQLSVRSSINNTGNREITANDCFEPFVEANMRMSPREAFFARKRRVNIKESIGRISGELICPYPPGIPLMIPGEIITERGVDYLLSSKKNGAAISGASDSKLSSIVVCCE